MMKGFNSSEKSSKSLKYSLLSIYAIAYEFTVKQSLIKS